MHPAVRGQRHRPGRLTVSPRDDAAEQGGRDRPDVSPLALGALISAVPFAPLGIVLGVLAKRQIRKTGQAGDGLATAAIVLGALITLFFVVRAV